MKRKIVASTNSKFLAVFWYIDGQFFGPEDTIDGRDACQFGDYLQVDDDHYSAWNQVRRELQLPATDEYDKYPRGRVMFNTKIHKFKVVADPKIVDNPKVRDALIAWYGLPAAKGAVLFETDEHYQSYEDED